jgi:hypothetical protein
MDVMAYSASRSGNYRPQRGYMQKVFPDREVPGVLGQIYAITSQSGNIVTSKNAPTQLHVSSVLPSWLFEGAP